LIGWPLGSRIAPGFRYEVIAAGASGDLGYIVGMEHTTVSIAGAPPPPEPYVLRVTTIFRRENDRWKVVHRHADPMPDSRAAEEQLARMVEESG
jgi:ketosteroid isomerase-like protein